LAVDAHRRAPDLGFAVVVPDDFAGLGVEAPEEAVEVGCENQAVVYRNGRSAAVHALFFGDAAVAVEVLLLEFPDDAGIGIGNSLASAFSGCGGVSEQLIAGFGLGNIGVDQLS